MQHLNKEMTSGHLPLNLLVTLLNPHSNKGHQARF